MKLAIFIAGVVLGYVVGKRNCNDENDMTLVLGLLHKIMEIEGRKQ